MLLHSIDSLDEVEEGFGALGVVGDGCCGFVGGFEDGVVAEIFKDVAVDVEFLGGGHIEMVEKWDEVAKSGFFDLVHAEVAAWC